MTAPDGFPGHMDTFAIDAVTAERLLGGAVDVGDAPPEYRAVATVFEVLREAPDSVELVGRTAAVDRIAAAVVVVRRPGGSRRSRRSVSRRRRRVAASVLTCAVVLTSVLATAGALPESAQAVASTVLSRVGISVPTGGGNPADQQPPPPPSGPAPTATRSVPSTPAGNRPGVPASGADAGPTSPHGKDPGHLHGSSSRGTRAPKTEDGGHSNSPDGSSATGNGDSNSSSGSSEAGNSNPNGHGK
jgi:hypothetical protein